MSTTADLIGRLMDREGGFSNDPTDPGGATCWGITRATLAAYRQKAVTVDEVKQLSRIEAGAIYQTIYLGRYKIGQLPDSFIEQLLDFAVNSGPLIAIQAFQEILGVTADAVIGPQTIATALIAPAAATSTKLMKWRIMMFARICRRDPSQLKFLGGWLARALIFA